MAESKEISQQEPSNPKRAESAKRKHVFRIVGIGMGTVILCPILVHYGRVWIPMAWGDLRFVNYFVAFIPTILSMLFAFVIDKDLERHMKRAWRLGIVACGVLYSVALWHQQELTDKSSLVIQNKIVNDAVNTANQHSDSKIGSVQKEVQGVKTDVGGVKTDLKDTKDALSKMVTQSASDITSSISKVGKPDPPDLAQLQFTFFPEPQSHDLPVLTRSISRDKDGNVPVDISFTNISGTTAEIVELWINLCTACSFAAEPFGFDKPKGLDERMRHRQLPGPLNPGVSFEKTTIMVNFPMTPSSSYFEMGFTYSCKTCGKRISEQKLIIYVQPYAAVSSRDATRRLESIPCTPNSANESV